ncbi:MAG: ABC transporter ATP-binding protein [Chloroflexota bacterium]|nr:ABC transporter ATP-binding protein [Chloroflexota bacterium]
MTARRAGPTPTETGQQGRGDAVVEARELYKRYGARVAVDGASFAVRRGEVFGLLGPNGAGKSTTLELLEGLRDPDGGAALIDGLEVRRHRRTIQARIGVQVQSTALFADLSVLDNLRLLAALYPRSVPVKGLLDDVGLADRAGARLGALSGGQQQRLALAAALVNDPAVVFLDEPTTGLDPQARRAIWALVERLRERGKTIVLTTHYMEEAETLCDRIAIMEGGRIVALDTPAGLIARHGGERTIVCVFDGGSTVERSELARLPAVSHVAAPDGGEGAGSAGGAFTLQTHDLERTLFALLHFAERRGAPLTDLRVRQPSLEDVFLTLTGRALRD